MAVYRYGVVLLVLTAAFTFAMIAPAGRWALVVSALLQGGAVLAALSRAQAGRRLLGIGLAAIAVTVAVAVVAAFGDRYLGGASDLAGAATCRLSPWGEPGVAISAQGSQPFLRANSRPPPMHRAVEPAHTSANIASVTQAPGSNIAGR